MNWLATGWHILFVWVCLDLLVRALVALAEGMIWTFRVVRSAFVKDEQ